VTVPSGARAGYNFVVVTVGGMAMVRTWQWGLLSVGCPRVRRPQRARR
jgi:hypothetical protein